MGNLVPVPQLTMEQRAQLMIEILMYLENFEERIWQRTTPSAGVADLLRGIAKNKHCNTWNTTWLKQVLKKAPPLWEKTKPYFTRTYDEA